MDIDQLAAAITNAVRDYTEEVSDAIEKKVESVADEVLAAVEELAPKQTGKYAKGFKKTDVSRLRGGKKYAIWNKKDYRRVHLLEFGHAKRGGGRVRAYPHMRPAFDEKAGSLVDDIKRIVRNGGGT